jgi:hypothetical protein
MLEEAIISNSVSLKESFDMMLNMQNNNTPQVTSEIKEKKPEEEKPKKTMVIKNQRKREYELIMLINK